MVHTMQCMPLIAPSTKAHSVRPFHLNVCLFLHFLPCIPVNRNPTSSIAAIKTSLFVLVGSYTIQAHFSSRLTLTEWTPSMSCRTDWMRLTQEWHVIPSTPNTVLVTGDAIVVFLSSKRLHANTQQFTRYIYTRRCRATIFCVTTDALRCRVQALQRRRVQNLNTHAHLIYTLSVCCRILIPPV